MKFLDPPLKYIVIQENNLQGWRGGGGSYNNFPVCYLGLRQDDIWGGGGVSRCFNLYILSKYTLFHSHTGPIGESGFNHCYRKRTVVDFANFLCLYQLRFKNAVQYMYV